MDALAVPRGRRAPLGVVVVSVTVLAGLVSWWLFAPGDRRTGPDPTVPAVDSCGGDAPGTVVALDADTGSVRWSALVGRADQLLLLADTLVVAGGGALRALAVDGTGARWCRDVSASGDEANGAVVAGEHVVAASKGGVAAFGGRDGAAVWERSGTWDRLSSTGDHALLSRRGAGSTTRTTDALAGATGRRAWRHSTAAGRATSTSPTQLVFSPDADLTYLDDDGAVRAVDGQGVERWMASGLRPVAIVEGFLVTVGSGAAFGDVSRQELVLVVLDQRTGAEVWRKTVPGFDAVVAGGAIVVADQTNGTATDLSGTDSTVGAYAVADGAERWDVATALAVGVHATGDRVLVETAGDDTMAAVDAGTGRVVWTAHPANPGRSERYHAGDRTLDTAFDPESRTVFVLLAAVVPEGD